MGRVEVRSRSARHRALLVQQSAWDTPKLSMPFAAGYMKAAADSLEHIRERFDVEILNFRGGKAVGSMARALLSPDVPDVVGFSVLGWNVRQFAALAETFKSVNPEGWVVFGGTHVAHQARSVFRRFPAVDVVVNGEGDFAFADLLAARLEDGWPQNLSSVRGISFVGDDGSIVTTEERPRIDNLDSIPSPLLTNSIRLRDQHGQFPYDVAIMETNRGCPYRCSFCYWGGAVGQRVREFSRERLREELDVLGSHQVETVVLCDANFGMRSADAHFLEDLITTREKHGYPRAFETSWAKNKSHTFYDIVRRMKQQGFSSSFTLALQTLDPTALDAMARRNMQLNEWEEVVRFLDEEGLDVYAELIWGAPGETVESFLEGYDRLAQHISRIAVYPLMLLPNTGYDVNRDLHGFVTIRGDRDDFEYVLANRSTSYDDHLDMHRFMFWSRAIAENMYFRHIWKALRTYAGLKQSDVLRGMADWFESSREPAAIDLIALYGDFTDSDLVIKVVRMLHLDPRMRRVFEMWWNEAILPSVPEQWRALLDDIYRYDVVTRPVTGHEEGRERTVDDGVICTVLRDVEFTFDVPAVLDALRKGQDPSTQTRPWRADVLHPIGFEDNLENHEIAAHYAGRVRPVATALHR